jgi:cytochrome P450
MDAIDILAALGTHDGRADPYPLYAALHEIGEVIPAGPDLVVVVGHGAVNSVLRDPSIQVCDQSLFDERVPGWRESPAYLQVADWVSHVNDPRHARLRSLVARSFTPRRIAGLEPAIITLTDELLDAMAAKGADGSAVDFMHDFAFLLPVTVICELIGIPTADREAFRSLARSMVGIMELPGPAARSVCDAAAVEMLDYVTELAAEREAKPRDDLASDLVAISALDPERLTRTELLHNLTLLLVAGFETTSHLLGNGLQIVLDDPQAGTAVRDGSVSPPAFVEEILRFEPPLQYTYRVGYDTSVGGVPMSVHTTLMIVLAAGNRDPRRFAEASRFDPRRQDGGSLSFGGGAHYCIGAALSRLQGAIAFPRLLNRFPAIKAADVPTRQDKLLFMRGFAQLPVTVS